jgi:dihydroorotase
VVEKMSHNPAILFGIEGRGFIRKGYHADFVLVNPSETTAVDKPSLLYKCGWSPMEGYVFANKIVKTFVNGKLVYSDGVVNGTSKGMPLSFAN